MQEVAMNDSNQSGRSGNAEPQSYGSNGEWLKGKTGQTVERTPERTDRHDESFYESRHELPPDRSIGGKVGEIQAAESSDPMDETAPAPSVTGTASTRVATDSDQRKSYFRDRDYR
jgi:hypothetical protein